ncbi:MAG: NADH-quinone oxidoreductase subunit N, partial [Gemmatimonadaceae bacterium]
MASLDRFGPELAVMFTAGLVLLADLVVPRRHKQWLAGLSVAGLAAAAIWLVILVLRSREASFFDDSMSLDNFSIFFIFLFIAVSGTVIIASLDYMPRFGNHQGEFFALLL